MSNKITVIGLSYERVCAIAVTRSKEQDCTKHVQARAQYAGLDEAGLACFEVGFTISDWYCDATVATFTRGEQNV